MPRSPPGSSNSAILVGTRGVSPHLRRCDGQHSKSTAPVIMPV
nr:MAG TPA: hypothetical protein [Caudoviricetes sp.]